MLFSDSTKNIIITKGVLAAQCKKADLKTFVQSSISLTKYIGNVDGKLTWGGQGFSNTAETVHVVKGVLTARLKNQAGKLVVSKLDLNQHIQNVDGVLRVIPQLNAADTEKSDEIKSPTLMKSSSSLASFNAASSIDQIKWPTRVRTNSNASLASVASSNASTSKKLDLIKSHTQVRTKSTASLASVASSNASSSKKLDEIKSPSLVKMKSTASLASVASSNASSSKRLDEIKSAALVRTKRTASLASVASSNASSSKKLDEIKSPSLVKMKSTASLASVASSNASSNKKLDLIKAPLVKMKSTTSLASVARANASSSKKPGLIRPPPLVRMKSAASLASVASASAMFSAASSISPTSSVTSFSTTSSFSTASSATSVSTSSVKKSLSSASSSFPSSQFKTSSNYLLLEDTCTKLELKGTFLHADCHRLDGSVSHSHLDLNEIIGFIDGRLEWDLTGFNKHCFEHALDGFFLVVKYYHHEGKHRHDSQLDERKHYRIAHLDLRLRLCNADGILIIVEKLNKNLPVVLSEVPWMKFRVIAQPDFSIFANHPVMQEALTHIVETTIEHVTREMHKQLTMIMEAAIVAVTTSAMNHVETLLSDSVGHGSASASMTTAESLHLSGAARASVQARARRLPCSEGQPQLRRNRLG